MGIVAEPHGDRYPAAALVTGAAKRIGRALALDLAAQGYAVAVHYHHSAAEAAAVVAEIAQAGGRAVALQADLAQEAETARLVERATKALGPLGLLVNNASIFEFDDLTSATRSSWDLHLETNLRAPLVLTQSFVAALPEPWSGLVVNIIDARVLHPTPRHLSYTVSKTALWALTQSLAKALAPRIRVNAVAPGPVLPSCHQDRAAFDLEAAGTLLGHACSPEEIAEAVLFLAAAPSVTGQVIAVDSGQHLGWRTPDIAAG